MIRLLFLGDVVGEPGIRCLQKGLREISEAYQPDLILANGENAAPEGKGLSASAAERLWDAGVEIITLGNHAWDHRDVINRLNKDLRIVRPANFPGNSPGHGFTFVSVKGMELLIINLLGRALMNPMDCPFQKLDQLLAEHGSRSRHILLDFHAETTSEKLAMAWEFDGRISALVGTHTHVATADERLLTKGTGYITDVGMCGPYNGIIGVRQESVIRKFRTQLPVRFEVSQDPALQLNGVVIDLDDDGRCASISRVTKLLQA